MPGFPPAAAERIAEFLRDGATGTVELHVKEGRVLAIKVIESHRFDESETVRPEVRPVDDQPVVLHYGRR